MRRRCRLIQRDILYYYILLYYTDTKLSWQLYYPVRWSSFFRAIIVLGILNNFVATGNSHKMLNDPKLMSFITIVHKTKQVSLILWSSMFIILRVYLTNTYLCVMQRRNGNRKTDKLTEKNVCLCYGKCLSVPELPVAAQICLKWKQNHKRANGASQLHQL